VLSIKYKLKDERLDQGPERLVLWHGGLVRTPFSIRWNWQKSSKEAYNYL